MEPIQLMSRLRKDNEVFGITGQYLYIGELLEASSQAVSKQAVRDYGIQGSHNKRISFDQKFCESIDRSL